TPLGIAAGAGHAEVVRALVEKVGVRTTAAKDKSAMDLAAESNRVDVIDALLQLKASPEYGSLYPPLFWAAAKGRVEAARHLLEGGAPVDGRSRDGASPLLVASYVGNLELVKLLLERGAALEQRNPQGGTALRAAADAGHIDVVRYLLGRGAKKNTF